MDPGLNYEVHRVFSSGCAGASVVSQPFEQAGSHRLFVISCSALNQLPLGVLPHPYPLVPTTDLNHLLSPYLNDGSPTEDFCENISII